MKLQFYGAAGCVTGSCHLIKIQDKNILLDCGTYQGKDEKERSNEEFSFNPKEIDYVVLSHAHIDHSGRIPLLYKKGFKGKVICTEGTKDLCGVMLPDSGHILEMETQWKNRKRIRKGLPEIEPLYTAKIAELSTYLFEGYGYNEWIEVFDGFKIRFQDAGHLLGSSIVEMIIKEENEEEIKLVYSGDLGNKNIPILKDPTFIDYADYVILETTYGNRLHSPVDLELKELLKIIKDTMIQGGNVVIPSFAVGRTQQILYALHQYAEDDQLKGITVYVDSPLAIESTKIFENHKEYFDEEAQKIIRSGQDPLDFKQLVFASSLEESREINEIVEGAVIISASGMCDAGRIKHHLKHNLWRKECSIVFVGYQAIGTLGRIILEGAEKVKLFGEEIVVNARIYNLEGLSGHADQQGLLDWLDGFKKKPKEVFLVHGDLSSQEAFQQKLQLKGYHSKTVHLGDTFNTSEAELSKEEKVKGRLFRLIDGLDVQNLKEEELLALVKDCLQ